MGITGIGDYSGNLGGNLGSVSLLVQEKIGESGRFTGTRLLKLQIDNVSTGRSFVRLFSAFLYEYIT